MSRKLFGTDGVRGQANSFPMTAEVALRLGAAAGRYRAFIHVASLLALGSAASLRADDAACDVLMSPYTIHGCRPTSVTVQPKAQARYGRGTA